MRTDSENLYDKKKQRKKVKQTETNKGKGYVRSKTHQDAGKVKKSENMKKWKEADWIRRGNQRPLRAGSTETQALKKNT